MSKVKAILQALIKVGVATYGDLEAETKLERSPLRWSCATMKKDGHIKQTEEPLSREVAWQITPHGRQHLIKIAGDGIVAAPPLKKDDAKAVPAKKEAAPITDAMAKAKAKAVKKSSGKLQTTPAEGGANIIRSRASDSHVVAASTSSEGAVVVEQPVADDSPLPAGSDVTAKKYQHLPKLNVTINQLGCLELGYGKDRFAIPSSDVSLLVDFLDATEALWSKAA